MSILATTDSEDGRRPPLRPATATIVPLTADAGGGVVDWAEVVESHEPALRRLIARRMVNQELVEDALQETYLRAVRSCRVGQGTPDGPWLRTVARRASTDVYRGEPPPAVDLDALALAADVVLPGSDEHLERVESHQALRWALARLSPRHRRLLALRTMHELTYQEIGAVENLSEEAVSAALNRARARLRAHLYAYESRRALPAVGLWLGHLVRRVRWRAQAFGPRLVEWAGATIGVGVIAAMAVAPVQPPALDPPGSVAGEAWTEVSFVGDLASTGTEAFVGSAAAPPGSAPSDVGAPPVAPQPERPVLAGHPEVRVTPEDSRISYRVELGGPNNASAEVVVPVDCTRSRTAGEACTVLRKLPGAS